MDWTGRTCPLAAANPSYRFRPGLHLPVCTERTAVLAPTCCSMALGLSAAHPHTAIPARCHILSIPVAVFACDLAWRASPHCAYVVSLLHCYTKAGMRRWQLHLVGTRGASQATGWEGTIVGLAKRAQIHVVWQTGSTRESGPMWSALRAYPSAAAAV